MLYQGLIKPLVIQTESKGDKKTDKSLLKSF